MLQPWLCLHSSHLQPLVVITRHQRTFPPGTSWCRISPFIKSQPIQNLLLMSQASNLSMVLDMAMLRLTKRFVPPFPHKWLRKIGGSWLMNGHATNAKLELLDNSSLTNFGVVWRRKCDNLPLQRAGLATGNTARHPLLLFSVDGLLRQTASELYNEGDKITQQVQISYHSTIGEIRPLQIGDHIIRNFQQNVPLKIYPYNMNKILNHLC